MNQASPSPKKALGQHWLHDPAICARIVALAQPSPGHAIFEIGPGQGALTRGLLDSGARVTALETDPAAIEYLEDRFSTEIQSGALNILEGDARKVDLPPSPAQTWTVVSNLPYNVGTIIFLKLLEQREIIDKMVLMFQAEVAQRILGQPGTKNNGFLSVLTRLEWHARRAMKVRPGAFKPPPRVQSEVLHLEPMAEGSGWGQPRHEFRAFVDTAFHTRRKMLRNVLVQAGFKDDLVRKAFRDRGISDKVRAEALTAGVFRELYELLVLNK